MTCNYQGSDPIMQNESWCVVSQQELQAQLFIRSQEWGISKLMLTHTYMEQILDINSVLKKQCTLQLVFH